MWSVSAEPVRFDEAVRWFDEKLRLPDPLFRYLKERARQRAFWVAGVANEDLLAWLWRSLLRAIYDGTPYGEWATQVTERLQRSWGGPNPGRLETVFRTNVQQAYNAGRYAQLTDPRVLRVRPFWMYDATLDDRTTQICRARHGTIKPADDPWWRSNYPPLHFNCRAGVRALTPEEVLQRGIKPMEVMPPPQEGFGLAPSRDVWEGAVASEVRRDARGVWKPAMDPVPSWEDYGLPRVLEVREAPRGKAPPLPAYFKTRAGFVLVDADAPGSPELIAAILAAPTEVWALPMEQGERAALRVTYIAVWEPGEAHVLIVQRGVVVEVLKLTPDGLDMYRRGVLYYTSER